MIPLLQSLGLWWFLCWEERKKGDELCLPQDLWEERQSGLLEGVEVRGDGSSHKEGGQGRHSRVESDGVGHMEQGMDPICDPLPKHNRSVLELIPGKYTLLVWYVSPEPPRSM